MSDISALSTIGDIGQWGSRLPTPGMYSASATNAAVLSGYLIPARQRSIAYVVSLTDDGSRMEWNPIGSVENDRQRGGCVSDVDDD